MAGRGISIDILANVRDALRGIGDVEQAVADVESTLEDMAREGDDSVDRMTRGFRDLAKDADKSADSIERDYKDAYKSVGRAAKDAGDDSRKGFSKASEGAAEFKDEANSTAREAAASFDGSAESIGDAFQEVAANAFSGFGPAGAAAGIAAAAGIGLVSVAFQQAEERRETLTERANDLAEAYIEAGSSVLDALTQVDRFTAVLTDPETRKEAEQLAKFLGGDLSLATRILAGDEDALSEARTRQRALMDEQTIAGVALKKILDEQSQVQRDAKETAALVTDEYLRQINATKDVTLETDKLGNSLYTLPGGKQIVIDAETGQASENLEVFKGDLDGVAEKVVKPVVRLVVDDTAVDNYKPDTKYAEVVYQATGNVRRRG